MFRALIAVAVVSLGAAGVAHANGGTIKGAVKLAGKAPERKDLNMKADPFCAKQPPSKDEEVVVGPAGQLKNVAVRIAKGFSGQAPAPSGDAVLDQKGCMYRPRVVVAQAGQTVAIKNSDQTLHNVHTYKGPATLFNQAQVFGMPDIKKKFGPGDIVKFKCDVHPWMTAYVLVSDNPHFAVTGDDGAFTIANVPPGKYTIEAWHEKYGTKTVDVTVAAGKTEEIKLEFAAK
jgi:plastocyanin